MGTDGTYKGRALKVHGRGVYLVALALALLSLAACGAQTRGRASTPTPTATATATATPTSQLAFRPITLPPGFQVLSVPFAVPRVDKPLAVSPVDGKDAWACVGVGTGAFQIWTTTDEGSTWHAAGLLHLTAPMQPGSCGMLADARDTQAAVFGVEWGGEAGDLGGMSFYTRDGGQHWQQLPGWTIMISVDSDGTRTYAAVNVITPPPTQQQPPPAALLAGVSPPRFSAPGPGTSNQERWEFVVSSDGLQTWRELHPGGLTSQGPGFQFWYGPTSGELFAETYNGVFWHSLDGGVSWTLVSTSNWPASIGRWLASRTAWMFCTEPSFASPPSMLCSMDTGNTWRKVPALAYTAQCVGRCGKDRQPPDTYTPTTPCPPLALASDGSLLAICPTDSGAPDQILAYRLAPGAAKWLALGPVPSGACQVSANGIMWCMNAQDGEWETTSLPA